MILISKQYLELDQYIRLLHKGKAQWDKSKLNNVCSLETNYIHSYSTTK